MICKKIFLSYDTAAKRIMKVNEKFLEVFQGWDIVTGDSLLDGGVDSKIAFAQFKDKIKNRVVLIDFTSYKDDIPYMNYNTLVELGIALGMNRPCYLIFNSKIIERGDFFRKVSDLSGVSCHSYENEEQQKTRFEEALAYFKNLKQKSFFAHLLNLIGINY